MGAGNSAERCRPPKLESENGQWVACSAPLNAAYSEGHLTAMCTERDQKFEKRYRELYHALITMENTRYRADIIDFENKLGDALEKRDKNITYGLSEKLKASAEATNHTLNVWDVASARPLAEFSAPQNIPIRALAVLGMPRAGLRRCLSDLERSNGLDERGVGSEPFPLGCSVMYQEMSSEQGLYLWNLKTNERRRINLPPVTATSSSLQPEAQRSDQESVTSLRTPLVQWMLALPHARVVLVCAKLPVEDFLRFLDTTGSSDQPGGFPDNENKADSESKAVSNASDIEELRTAAASLMQYIHPIFVVSVITGQVIGFHAVDAPAHTVGGRILYTAGSTGTWGALRQFDIFELQPRCALASSPSPFPPQQTLTGRCTSPLRVIAENEMTDLQNVILLQAVPAANMLIVCSRRGISNDYPEGRYNGIMALRLDKIADSSKQPIGPTIQKQAHHTQPAAVNIAAARSAIFSASSNETIVEKCVEHATAVERSVPAIMLPQAWFSEEGAAESVAVITTRTVLPPYTDRVDNHHYSHLLLASCTSTHHRAPEDISSFPAPCFLPIPNASEGQSAARRPTGKSALLIDGRERSLGQRLGGHESSFTGLEAHSRGWLLELSTNPSSKAAVAESKYWGRILFSGQLMALPGGTVAIKSFDPREPWVRFLDSRVRHMATWTPFAIRGVSVLQYIGADAGVQSDADPELSDVAKLGVVLGAGFDYVFLDAAQKRGGK